MSASRPDGPLGGGFYHPPKPDTLPGKGKLLIASPALPDPNFDRSVVLLLEHGEEGTLGLILNRPSEVRLSTALPQWEHLAVEPSVVFVGGPVSPGAAICLGRYGDVDGSEEPRRKGESAGSEQPDLEIPKEFSNESDEGRYTFLEDDSFEDGFSDRGSEGRRGWRGLFGNLGVLDLSMDPIDLAPGLQGIRVYSGYAGWAPEQLDSEISAGAWFVVPALDEDIFFTNPGELWRSVLRRQKGNLRLLANYPEDLSSN
ncbi:MAG: YqgE/AlgH family protein [Actinobacteria bacterium]|nr:YqgE/AlgH family protein [Actinomycetota bacterium]